MLYDVVFVLFGVCVMFKMKRVCVVRCRFLNFLVGGIGIELVIFVV